jgi:ABC-type uncharacterized transport system permease subunit
MLMGFRFKNLPLPPSAPRQDAFLAGHVAFSMLAYAFFTTASGLGLAYLVQNRQLKNKHLGRVAYQLPPLEAIERLCFLCVAAGFTFLTVGLAAGMVWGSQTLGRLPLDDPKAAFSLALWLLYGTYLGLRLAGRFRGRRSATLLLFGFLVFFFGYYLVNVYGGGHRFLN